MTDRHDEIIRSTLETMVAEAPTPTEFDQLTTMTAADTAARRRRSPITAAAVGFLAVVVAVGAIAIFGLPSDGFATWRSPSGYSDSYAGSTSYNPFVDIKAGLIDQTDNPLFQAGILGVDPSTVRFRTVTLDVYRDGRWSTDRIHAFPIDEEPWIDSTQQYRGPTIEMMAEITIQNLRQPWMPAPATPSAALASTDGDTKTIRVRRLDGSLSFQEPMYEGMKYTVLSDIPTYTPEVLSQLLRTESGELSPLFETAEAAGETIPPLGQENERIELVDNDFWIEVPDDLGSGVQTLARTRTRNMTTNFEKALALEHYFRLSGEFVYDTAVPNEYITGDVSDWLTDPANPYARHGYSEQFTTAMALVGRSVGVPSRVVLGFTPGDTLNDTVVQVKGKNAHAWVEMWIPTYGWMAFDPTPRSGHAAVTADESLTALLDFSPSQYLLAIP